MHRVLHVFVLIIPFIQCFLLRGRLAPIERRLLFANPVNADGTKYRSGVTEEQAFEWFDEAVIFTRGGSGGAGCNSFRYGKARQHLGMCSFASRTLFAYTSHNFVHTLFCLQDQSGDLEEMVAMLFCKQTPVLTHCFVSEAVQALRVRKATTESVTS